MGGFSVRKRRAAGTLRAEELLAGPLPVPRGRAARRGEANVTCGRVNADRRRPAAPWERRNARGKE